MAQAKWTDKLSGEVYRRLCECRNTKADLPLLVNARWDYYKEIGKDKQGFKKEDALVFVLELLDANSQWMLADITRDEYNALIAE